MICFRFVPVVLVMLALVCSPAKLVAAEAGQPLVAKVGNIAITEEELQREVQELIPMQVSYHGGIKPEKLEAVKNDALQKLINRAYKFQYAIKEEVSVDPQEFNDAWNAYAQKMNGRDLPPQMLEKIKAGFYQDMLANKAERQAVDDKITVSDEEIKTFYEKHKQSYLRPRLYTASHIFLKVDPSATLEEKAKRRKQAEDLYAKAIAGEDFYNLAYYNSDDRTRYVGGSLGQFHAGQTVREFDSALSKMEAGDVSKPIQTIYGFHIIKLDSVEESRQLSFDEVAGMLQQQTVDSRRKEVYQAWMDELKTLYPLELFNAN